MANVIDALFITLGLDAREYKKNEKEVTASLKKFGDASAKQTKLIAEHTKKAAGAFSALKIEILGALAAFGMGAGFKAFIQDSMNAQATVGRTADALGISARSLRAWTLMATEMGESGDAAVGTLNKVAAGMAAARRGDIGFISTANKYGAGLNMGDDVETSMAKINRMAYAIREKYGRQQAMGVLGEMGIGDFLQQQRLMESPAKFAADYAHAMSLSGGMTAQSIAQAEELQRKWADFMRQMENLRNRVFAKLEPVLIRLGTEFSKWLDSVDWDKVIADIGSFIDKVQALIGALGGVKGILIEIAAIKVLGWMGSIAGWVLKLHALTVALRAARAAAAAGGAAAAAGGAGAAAAADAGAAAGAAEGAAAEAKGGAGLLSKFGWLRVFLRGAMWAPRPAESPEQFREHLKKIGLLDKDKESYWQTWEDVFHWRTHGPVAASHPSVRPQIGLAEGVSLSGTIPRGMRNNNPGNIKYGAFARSMGATGQDTGGFAIFPSAQAGIAAIVANLRSYGRKGFDTPSEIAHRWSTTDQAAYTKTLAALFGGNADKQLDMTNNSVLSALANGIVSQENGKNPYASLIANSLNMAYSGAPRSAQAGASKATSVTSDVHIGTLNINAPKATDANGIAKSAQKAFRTNPLIAGYVTASA